MPWREDPHGTCEVFVPKQVTSVSLPVASMAIGTLTWA